MASKIDLRVHQKLSNDELVDTLSEMETQIQELGRTGDRLLMYSEVHEAYLKVCHASSLLVNLHHNPLT